MLCLPLSTRLQREQAFPWHHKASWGKQGALEEIAKPSDHAGTSEAGDKDVGVQRWGLLFLVTCRWEQLGSLVTKF